MKKNRTFILIIFLVLVSALNGQTIGRFKIASAGIFVERQNKKECIYSLVTKPNSYLTISRDAIRIMLDDEIKIIPLDFKPNRIDGGRTITEITCIDLENDRCNFGLFWDNKDANSVSAILRFTTHTLSLVLIPLVN